MGTDLDVTLTCPLFFPDGLATGTVNATTGEFVATGGCGFYEPYTIPFSIGGTPSSDGLTITGGYLCPDIFPFTLGYTATKCGNGVIDAGEDCEPGPCCSDSCQWDDGALCGTDLCNEGVCNAAGTCVATAPYTAGTPCQLDSNNCTIEECDGAGNCEIAETLVCNSCSFCNESGECEGTGRNMGSECRRPRTVESRLTLSKRGGIDRVRWHLGRGHNVEVSALGDPITTDGYELCVFYRTGLNEPWKKAAAARAEPGPGWIEIKNGFRFTDRAAPNGLSRVKLRASDIDGQTLISAAAGSQIIGPSDLSALGSDDPRFRLQAELRAANGECWGADFSSGGTEIKATENLLRARPGG
jgi:hypothetical protein